jgi:outer membrane PBP1 activator LpoA protein
MNAKIVKILIHSIAVLGVVSGLLITGCTRLPSRQTFILPQTVDRVALLLPLSGMYGRSGQAVRNGFLAAYYADRTAGEAVPVVNVFDTASGENINGLYQQAVSQGAQFIIGPLLQFDLEQIKYFSVPTISLNWLSSGKIYKNLYQFGLSALDEVSQAVYKMSEDGHENVLVIVPKNAWGKHLEKGFVDAWTAMGKRVISVLEFSDAKTLNHNIEVLLNVDQVYAQVQQMRQVIRKQVRVLPRRRQDFDAVFLAASSNMAKQIVPSLRFYYVHSVPIYALSSIYSVKANQVSNLDLDGVIFCDIPWLLLSENQLPADLFLIHQQIQDLWAQNAAAYPRFYALGIDSFLIFKHFNILGLSAAQMINGASGLLYLSDDQHIRRILTWAEMKNGQPVLMNDNN